ncbi:uncharacterized protein LOC136080132 [Hydra vulgaris]|uniref:Uncharacterized protein LOC136080132 n=1 Tax=Hydra vulgaris TaxID=6087 RepID=A0ABM4BUG3_HYDVU
MRLDEYKAIKKLKKGHSIIIKKTEKGGGICVLDKKEYENKINIMLEDKSTYEDLKEDPTSCITNKVLREIEDMRRSMIITKRISEFIYPGTQIRTPLFYGLSKIHKKGIPLRPIVSGCEGPTNNVSEYVVKYLRPMAESLPSYFKDSTHLLETLSLTPIPPGEYMLVTADVVSLYTNIPHNDGILAVERFIRNQWKSLKLPQYYPPIIPIHQFSRLLRLILDNKSIYVWTPYI